MGRRSSALPATPAEAAARTAEQFRKHQVPALDELLDFMLLQATPMVKRLGHAFLRRLLRHAELVSVKSGARVVTEGDMGTEFYVLLQGTLALYEGGARDEDGKAAQCGLALARAAYHEIDTPSSRSGGKRVRSPKGMGMMRASMLVAGSAPRSPKAALMRSLTEGSLSPGSPSTPVAALAGPTRSPAPKRSPGRTAGPGVHVGVMRALQTFGEDALLALTPWSLTAIAAPEDGSPGCVLLRIDQRQFAQCLQQQIPEGYVDVLTVLRELPGAGALPLTALLRGSHALTERTFVRGHALAQAGGTDDTVHVLASGAAEVLGPGGQRLAELHRGQLVWRGDQEKTPFRIAVTSAESRCFVMDVATLRRRFPAALAPDLAAHVERLSAFHASRVGAALPARSASAKNLQAKEISEAELAARKAERDGALSSSRFLRAKRLDSWVSQQLRKQLAALPPSSARALLAKETPPAPPRDPALAISPVDPLAASRAEPSRVTYEPRVRPALLKRPDSATSLGSELLSAREPLPEPGPDRVHGAGEAKLSRPASARSERLPSVSEVPGAIAQAVASKPPRPQSARMSGRPSVSVQERPSSAKQRPASAERGGKPPRPASAKRPASAAMSSRSTAAPTSTSRPISASSRPHSATRSQAWTEGGPGSPRAGPALYGPRAPAEELPPSQPALAITALPPREQALRDRFHALQPAKATKAALESNLNKDPPRLLPPKLEDLVAEHAHRAAHPPAGPPSTALAVIRTPRMQLAQLRADSDSDGDDEAVQEARTLENLAYVDSRTVVALQRKIYERKLNRDVSKWASRQRSGRALRKARMRLD